MKKLCRSTDRIIAGVCGGIAAYCGIDPTVVRGVYAALTLFTAAFPGVLLYIVLCVLMPNAPADDREY